MIFTPRPYQSLIRNFILGHERANVFSSPGSGKTSATYDAIATLHMLGEAKRVLVLGPKRVAKSVWPPERDVWRESFGHLSVVAAVGTPEERLAAVRSKPDILCINYEMIDWLVDGYGDNWPFDMVVADECFAAGTPVITPTGATPIDELTVGQLVSTPIGPKKVTHVFRKRAKSLVEIQLVNGARIVCTPSHLFWTEVGWKAAEELGRPDLLHPPMRTLRSVVCDTAIPSDSSEFGPVLPSRLCYQEPHRQNANRNATSTGNADVDPQHREWGLECGAPVGAGSTRQSARKEPRPRSCSDWCARRQRSGHERSGTPCRAAPECRMGVELGDTDKGSALREHPYELQARLRQPNNDGVFGGRWSDTQDRARAQARREEDGSAELVGVASVTHIKCGSVQEVWDIEVEDAHVYYAVGVLVHNCSRIKGLRVGMTATGNVKGQGSVRAKKLATIAHKHVRRWINLTGSPAPNGLQDVYGIQWFVDSGRALGTSFKAFQDRWFHATETPDGYTKLTPYKSAQAQIESRMKPNTITIDVADWLPIDKEIERIIYVDLPPKARAAYRTMEKELFANIEQHAIEVFSAGGKANKCLQLANGSVFYEDGKWVKAHDEKIEALRSLVEEFNGEPILVRYIFQPDRDRILEAFPRAKFLDDKQSTIDDWNAGKIPILVTHAASAGHGLSLQHGGRVLVDYGSDFNLEHDEQVLARVGPVRQFQSGYKRAVFRFRIVARDTIEELSVLPRLKSKMSVQDSLKAAMRIRS